MIYDHQTVSSVTTSIEYDGTFTLPLVPATGYQIAKATIINADDETDFTTITLFEDITEGAQALKRITMAQVNKNYKVKILFELIP